MTDAWDNWEGDARYELTEKAEEAERLADRIAKRFWLSREEVFELMMGEDESGDDDH